MENNFNVTTFNGAILDKMCINDLMVGDIVRIVVKRNNDSLLLYTRIIKIFGDNDRYLGIIDDPYFGYSGFTCDVCLKFFDENNGVFACTDGYSECNMHYHKTCATQSFTCEYCYKDIYRLPFQNGDRVSFERSCIFEIPNWTENTTKICEIHSKSNIYNEIVSNIRRRNENAVDDTIARFIHD